LNRKLPLQHMSVGLCQYLEQNVLALSFQLLRVSFNTKSHNRILINYSLKIKVINKFWNISFKISFPRLDVFLNKQNQSIFNCNIACHSVPLNFFFRFFRNNFLFEIVQLSPDCLLLHFSVLNLPKKPLKGEQ